MCYRLLYGMLCLILSQSLVSGQNRLQTIVTDFANQPDLRAASVGIAVIDVESGQEVASFDAGRSLLPASNLKVLTTATALGVLGPDYRYETTLAYEGQIDRNGVLRGDLVLIGSGDPSLGSPSLESTDDLETLMTRLRLAVQQAGIRRIEGHIIGEAGTGSDKAIGDTWQWYDLANYYGAGAYGLNLHENLYYLRFQQVSSLGATPSIAEIEPAVPGLRWTNRVTSAARGSGDNAYIYGAPGSYDRLVRGTIPVGQGLFSIKGSLPDPPLFAAQQLAEALKSVGIIATQAPQARYADGPRGNISVLHTHFSPTLTTLVNRTNQKSVNLYAEALLRTMGQRHNKDGRELIRSFWTDRGLSFDGVYLEDGSGLSPRNGTPARFLAQMLRKAYLDKNIGEPLWNSLPLAGRTGSLRNAMRGTAAEGKLRAKSGTLERVRTFSGYAYTRSGSLLAFSILVNQYPGSGGDMRKRIYNLMAKFCE